MTAGAHYPPEGCRDTGGSGGYLPSVRSQPHSRDFLAGAELLEEATAPKGGSTTGSREKGVFLQPFLTASHWESKQAWECTSYDTELVEGERNSNVKSCPPNSVFMSNDPPLLSDD